MKKQTKLKSFEPYNFDEIAKSFTQAERKHLSEKISNLSLEIRDSGDLDAASRFSQIADDFLNGHNVKSEVVNIPVNLKVRGNIFNEFEKICVEFAMSKQDGVTEAMTAWIKKKERERILKRDYLICYLFITDTSEWLFDFLRTSNLSYEPTSFDPKHLPLIDGFQAFKVWKGELSDSAWKSAVESLYILSMFHIY